MSTRAEQIAAVERLVRESVASVDALAPEAMRALMPALVRARDELRTDLQQWLQSSPGAEDRFTAYQRSQALRSLEASLERVEQLEPAMAQALGVGRRAVGPLAVGNLDTEVQRLSAIFGGGVPTLPNLNTAAIIAKGDRLLWKRHERSAARYAGGIGDDIRQQFAVALAKGETFGQMTKRLAGNASFRSVVSAADPRAAAAMISEGMFHKWRHWGDRLVRTENMHAYNTQHDAAIVHVNENRAEGEEEYLRRWDASADKVTCERCKELHETTAPIDGTFKGGVTSPPLHPYCRCVVLAWLERWGNLKGETKARHREGGIMEPREPESKAAPAAAPGPADAIATPISSLPPLKVSDKAIEDQTEDSIRKIGDYAYKGNAAAAAARERLWKIYIDEERIRPDGTAERLKQEDVARLARHVLEQIREEARKAKRAEPKAPKAAAVKPQPLPAVAPAAKSAAVTSLPPTSKPATVAPVTAPATKAPPAAKPEKPITVAEVPGGWFVAERGSQSAGGKTPELARENLERQLASDAAAKAARIAEKEAKEQRKADKLAGKVAPPPAPSSDPTAIPATAQMGALRRAGLIERIEGGKAWRLNARGVAHFARKAQKKAATITGSCQICEGSWVVLRGKISTHGYSRPGYGFIVGECRGSRAAPWEVSCDKLPPWIDEMRGMLARDRESLAVLDVRKTFGVQEPAPADGPAPMANAVLREQWDGSKRWVYKGNVITRSVAVSDDDARFAGAREAERSRLTNQIRQLDEMIAMHSRRLASWSPDAAWIKKNGAEASGGSSKGGAAGAVRIAASAAREVAAAAPRAAAPIARAAPAPAPIAVAPIAKPTPAEPPPIPKQPKNAKRVAAAKVAAEASAEKRREIHSAARSNLPHELRVAWDVEGHKFMQEDAWRIKGVKDSVNASSTLSQAFAEKYGSGAETMQGNEGDRFFKRQEIEAKHAESWADEQTRKYYEQAEREARRNGEIDDDGEPTARGRSRATTPPPRPPLRDDDDPPF